MSRFTAGLRVLCAALCAFAMLALAVGNANGSPPAKPAGAQAPQAPSPWETAGNRVCEVEGAALPHGRNRRSDRSVSGGPPPEARAVRAADRPVDDTAPATALLDPPHPTAPSRSGELSIRLRVFRC
ncbi:hypothetical protein GCM10010420_40580 [Streptomyces glaucosporus]|uniref:Secreted protein n=1 Tax=Streptomyces glaucosporus TaxID=284044 RepID=A0ABN3INW3_9ACTN